MKMQKQQTNHYYSLFQKLSLSCLLAMFSYSSFSMILEGAGSSGGGQGLIYSNEEVRLLDFVKQEELPQSLLSEQDLNHIYYPQRYVKGLGTVAENFFACASRKMMEFNTQSHGKYPVLEKISNILNEVYPVLVKFRLFNLGEDAKAILENNSLTRDLPFYTLPSTSVSSKIQYPLAVYKYGRLWISEALYDRLNEVDRCGLAVHEAFRHLNYHSLLEEELSTREIEVLTRYVFGTTFDDDQIMLEGAFEKLSRPLLRASEYFELAKQSLEKAKRLKDTEQRYWDLINQASYYRTLAVSAQLAESTLALNELMFVARDVQEFILHGSQVFDLETLIYSAD